MMTQTDIYDGTGWPLAPAWPPRHAPQLETERLRLRAFSPRDIPDYIAIWADKRVTEFIGGEPRTAAVSWNKLLNTCGLWPLMGYGFWAIAEKDSDQIIGVGGFMWAARDMAELNGYIEAGWAIAPDYWGKGYMGEALAAMFGWADAHLLLESAIHLTDEQQGQGRAPIRAIIAPDNVASAQLAKRFGFADIGTAQLGDEKLGLFERL